MNSVANVVTIDIHIITNALGKSKSVTISLTNQII
jgi:hypothetical protein